MFAQLGVQQPQNATSNQAVVNPYISNPFLNPLYAQNQYVTSDNSDNLLTMPLRSGFQYQA